MMIWGSDPTHKELYDEGKSAETREEYRARPNVCDWCGYRVVKPCKNRFDFSACVNA